MDDSDLLKLSGVSGGTIAIILLVYKILKSVMGKKLVSNCCGRKMEVGIDVQDSTPKKDVCLEIKNPMIVDDKPIHSLQPIHRPQQREDRRDESHKRSVQVPPRQEASPHPDPDSGGV
jgi:hypothetical protein